MTLTGERGSVGQVYLAVAPLTDFSTWVRGSGLEVALLVLGSVLVTRFANWARDRFLAGIDRRDHDKDSVVASEAAKHRHTLVQVLTWVALTLMYTIVAVLVVQRLGVPISGLVAPATVVGVALGFGAQRIVQDVLAGFFIITERQYGFGDLVKLSVAGIPESMGTVEDLNLRVTRIRTTNGEVVIVPNGQIAKATNLSRDWARMVIDVPVPVSVDISRATEILQQVGREAWADPELRTLLLDAPTTMGVEDIDLTEFHIRLVARTQPGKQFVVGRDLRARVVTAFRHEGIVIPVELDAAGSGS